MIFSCLILIMSLLLVFLSVSFFTGVSTRQNRSVPPLRYDYVLRLKQDHPELRITINGGFDSVYGRFDFISFFVLQHQFRH
jgi:hypothetical protein